MRNTENSSVRSRGVRQDKMSGEVGLSDMKLTGLRKAVFVDVGLDGVLTQLSVTALSGSDLLWFE